ncbi:MAG: alpha/beta hydrolase, partial [Pseudomonadota bacterium]
RDRTEAQTKDDKMNIGRSVTKGVRRAIRTVTAVAMLCVLTVASAAAQTISLDPLTGVVWGSGNRNLVVILHGDGGPGRYDAYADALAKAARGTTVVTLTRPAFRYNGQKSPGQNPSKDHYTRRNNKLLAQSLATMKSTLGAGRLIVVGHSGGAAHLGTIIGAYPGIVDVAILAACPCNVPRWRVHRRGQNNWRQSQSPHRFAAKIPRSTVVYAVTTKNDKNTLPRFASEYVGIAQKAGANAQLIIPPSGGHGWRDYQRHVDALIRQNLR